MKRDSFIAWATNTDGWQADRYGHLQKEIDGKQYRFKLSSISARYEVKTGSGWVRIRSGYYSKLSINADGKLIGMTF